MSNPFVLVPPDENTAEGWLSQLDNRPRIIPLWPASQRMTLVAVVVKGYGTAQAEESVAYAITQPSQVDALVVFDRPMLEGMALFFTVPRSRVIPQCAGLTPESWATL